MPGISILMVTARKNPRYLEMCDSIHNAIEKLKKDRQFDQPIEAVFVDEQVWYDPLGRIKEVDAYVKDRFAYQIAAPKPTVWRGPYRKTNNNYWDKSSASNTAICLANYDYLTFIDDSTIVDENWLIVANTAMQMNVAFAGGYKYLKPGAVVQDGWLISGEIDSNDYRLKKYEYTQPCTEPGELFGGNMGVPLAVALKCEGYEELLSGSGGLEDCEFSVRVNRCCASFFFPDSVIHQLMDNHEPISGHAGFETAQSKGIPKWPTKLFPFKDGNGVVHQFTYNHLPIWWLTGHDRKQNDDGTWRSEYNPALAPHRDRFWSIGNEFSLRTLRKWIKDGKPWPKATKPEKDWRDSQKLEEL